jgi:hypothetical protein
MLGAALAATAAIGVGAGADTASGGPAALMPDLFTLPIERGDLVVIPERSKTVLRLSTEVENRGMGPLEVFPSAASQDCDGDGDPGNDRDASQRLFADTNASGAFESGADAVFSERVFGCVRYHPAHDHWHVLDFAQYELRREPGGRLVASSNKIGFCLADHRLVDPRAGTPESAHYPFGSSSRQGCDQTATQGLSVGWADAYPFSLPGQQLDVTGLRRGRYCLSSLVDPLDLLAEDDRQSNQRRVRLALRPNRLKVRRLSGPCRI